MIKNHNQMTFWEHIDELRMFVIKSVSVVIIFSIICSLYSESIKDFIINPVASFVNEDPNLRIVYNDPMSPFFLYISVSIFSGLLFSFPFIMYFLLFFLKPAVSNTKISFFTLILVISTFLFTLGIFFTYKLLIPLSFSFLVGFANGEEMIFNFNNIINKILLICLSVGTLFQMPIVAYFLGKINLLSSSLLENNRRYAILLSFLISALITPPDFISQLLLGIPIVMLFEICIVILKITGRNSN